MTAPTKIQIELRSVYGEEKAYPACATAEGFAAIAGTKTMTRHTLACVLGMGFTIEVVCRGVVVATFSGAPSCANLPAVR